MLEDAVYYSRREQDEITAARDSKDIRVQQIHLLLADKYGQLARRALAVVESEGCGGLATANGKSARTGSGVARRLR